MDEHNVDWSKVRRLEIHVGDEKKIVEQDGDSLCLRGLDLEEANTCLAQYGDSLEMLRICSGDISGLSFPEGLRVLDLSGMTLATLPESIRKLKKLKKLDLSHTHIGQLPEWLLELGLPFSREWFSLGIVLYGSETDGVDMSIFDQPQESILQWFEERKKQSEVPLNEIKVVFLGDGESGKTHILARLLNDGRLTDNFRGVSTPGIVVEDKNYRLDNRELMIHFWDFGGQEILHSMHRMFLTPRAFYVVVLNAQDGNQDDRARYWLHNLKSFANGAPVLLVLNKMDMNQNATVNESDLRKIYPGLTEIVRLSALKDSDTEFRQKFLDVMLGQIGKMDVLSFPFLPAWRQLKEKLQNMQANYIHGDIFRKFCDECGVHGSVFVRLDLLNWFSDLGVCFSFARSTKMEDYMILRPDWVTNAIYIILYNRTESVRNGMISHDTIYRMLSSEDTEKYRRTVAYTRYSREEVEYILGVLRKFRLSFIVDAGTEFMPMLCEANAAMDTLAYDYDPDALEFRVHYEYLPANVIHRLIVDRRKEVDRDHVWFTGARFVCGDTGRSAIVKSEGALIRILVRAEREPRNPQVYLDQLKDNLERINYEMGLTISTMEVVYKENGKTACFDYEDLMIAQEMGDTHIPCRELRKRVLLADVLKQSNFPEYEKQKKLITDLSQACEMLQDRKIYWHAGADERTDFLRDMLEAKGYLVFDQYRSSISAGGIRSGEMDLDIRLDPGDAWTALEALNLNGSSSSQIEYWNMHLKKLLDNYNEVGRSFLFQVSYVQCRKDAFHRIVNDFYEHLRFYSPRGFELMRGFVQVIPNDSGEAQHEFIRVAKCVYDCGGIMMTVFHFFVQIGDGITEVPAAPVILKEKKTPQIQDEDQVVRYEYRVVILGDSEAGKSHLLARLKDPQMEPTAFSGDVTHGIEIAQRTYTINECDVRVNYWDFGGQEILHSLQRLFLSKRALYIIVLNTRNDNQDAQADFWLRYVQTYASGAPVMLVLNKIDQNPRAALNMSLLRRRFRYTMDNCEVLRLSARDWSGKQFQDEFLNPLLTRIGKCLNRDCGFTARDVRIIDRLEQYKKDHQLIEFEVFQSLCEKEGLTDKKMRGPLAERLRHTGVLISFSTKIRMLLDPEWITRAIFILLEKQQALAESGMLTKDDIVELYLDDTDNKYRADQVEFILAIMREKELSFPYKQNHRTNEENEHKEFVPMLCYREEPAGIDTMEQEHNPVELQMHYDYLPPTVLHQLMVARNDELDMEKAWVSGAIFRNETGSTAIVRRDANVLTILVWGEETSYAIKYMDTLRMHIDQIAKLYLQIDTPAEVRIGYRVNGSIEYFNYNRLVNARACNILYTANSGKQHFCISVQDILDQTDRSEGRDVRELLRLVAAGCRELQMNQTYWFWESDVNKNGHIAPKMDENARNRLLRFKLEQSYAVKDQPQGGESSTGVSPGELDLWIGTDMDSPLAILEALNITGNDADSRKRWKEHLHRLVVNYNKPGYRCLVLVSYLNCPEKEMSGVQKVYDGLLKESTFEIYGGTQPSLDTEFLPNCPNLIQVTRADYSGGAGNISLYHFLVHIPRYLGDQ